MGAVNPRVLVSYSHDSQQHMDRVLAVTDQLRADGVDATVDQYIEAPPEGWPKWMARQIEGADFVLVVCTESYCRRFNGEEEPGRGLGATWKGAIITQHLFEQSFENAKFIPVVCEHGDIAWVPGVLKAVTYYDLSAPDGYERLYRRLTKQPLVPILPLGNIKPMPPRERAQSFDPVEPQPPMEVAHRPALRPAPAEHAPWDTAWILSHRDQAMRGLQAMGRTGFKEVCFKLLGAPLMKTQRELLNAADRAQVETFGWPIGVVLHRPEYRPQPRVDGITAEIVTMEQDHYQYWALRTNGDFYLLKSLFEDVRVANSIFYNTRVARATEVFQYAHNLYTELGVPTNAVLQVGVRYGGLKGRYLRAVGNRHLWDGRTTVEDDVQAVVSSPIGEIEPRIVDLVKGICSPLFMLFDFFELSDQAYRDIVTDFLKGTVS